MLKGAFIIVWSIVSMAVLLYVLYFMLFQVQFAAPPSEPESPWLQDHSNLPVAPAVTLHPKPTTGK